MGQRGNTPICLFRGYHIGGHTHLEGHIGQNASRLGCPHLVSFRTYVSGFFRGRLHRNPLRVDVGASLLRGGRSDNKITVPGDSGTEYNLYDFDKEDDPTSTAAVNFEYFLNERHKISLFYNPFDSRDTGTLTYPVNFAGVTYPANTPLQSSWRVHDVRARWHYNFMTPDPWNVDLGVGVA
ncbi:MAG: hypothetical protein IMF18_09845 [Proteobacteria bacterium]|nr:hypothetical protein [Pseudomonadota bacterium]